MEDGSWDESFLRDSFVGSPSGARASAAAAPAPETAEHVSVSIRIRPMNKGEVARDSFEAWRAVPGSGKEIQQHDRDERPIAGTRMPFDHVFAPTTTSSEIFSRVGRGIVRGVAQGFNGTIFVYGQTAAGKTHTMQGSKSEPGMLRLAANEIMNFITASPDREFLIRCSYLEIYNEVVRDLLDDRTPELKIHENEARGVFVNALEKPVTCEDDVLICLQKGERHRHVGETDMNQRSSRSHTIFRIVIENRPLGAAAAAAAAASASAVASSASSSSPSSGAGGAGGGAGGKRKKMGRGADGVLVGTLNLVDLAGSESVRTTNATGDRLVEAGGINKSLLTLSRVINDLASLSASDKPRTAYVSFRDSKLTRILQPSLAGNTRTAVICCVSPASAFQDETRSTLGFASSAKKIHLRATVNEVVDDHTKLRRLQGEFRRVKKLLDEALRVLASASLSAAVSDRTIVSSAASSLSMALVPSSRFPFSPDLEKAVRAVDPATLALVPFGTVASTTSMSATTSTSEAVVAAAAAADVAAAQVSDGTDHPAITAVEAAVAEVAEGAKMVAEDEATLSPEVGPISAGREAVSDDAIEANVTVSKTEPESEEEDEEDDEDEEEEKDDVADEDDDEDDDDDDEFQRPRFGDSFLSRSHSGASRRRKSMIPDGARGEYERFISAFRVPVVIGGRRPRTSVFGLRGALPVVTRTRSTAQPLLARSAVSVGADEHRGEEGDGDEDEAVRAGGARKRPLELGELDEKEPATAMKEKEEKEEEGDDDDDDDGDEEVVVFRPKAPAASQVLGGGNGGVSRVRARAGPRLSSETKRSRRSSDATTRDDDVTHDKDNVVDSDGEADGDESTQPDATRHASVDSPASSFRSSTLSPRADLAVSAASPPDSHLFDVTHADVEAAMSMARVDETEEDGDQERGEGEDQEREEDEDELDVVFKPSTKRAKAAGQVVHLGATTEAKSAASSPSSTSATTMSASTEELEAARSEVAVLRRRLEEAGHAIESLSASLVRAEQTRSEEVAAAADLFQDAETRTETLEGENAALRKELEAARAVEPIDTEELVNARLEVEVAARVEAAVVREGARFEEQLRTLRATVLAAQGESVAAHREAEEAASRLRAQEAAWAAKEQQWEEERRAMQASAAAQIQAAESAAQDAIRRAVEAADEAKCAALQAAQEAATAEQARAEARAVALQTRVAELEADVADRTAQLALLAERASSASPEELERQVEERLAAQARELEAAWAVERERWEAMKRDGESLVRSAQAQSARDQRNLARLRSVVVADIHQLCALLALDEASNRPAVDSVLVECAEASDADEKPSISFLSDAIVSTIKTWPQRLAAAETHAEELADAAAEAAEESDRREAALQEDVAAANALVDQWSERADALTVQLARAEAERDDAVRDRQTLAQSHAQATREAEEVQGQLRERLTAAERLAAERQRVVEETGETLASTTSALDAARAACEEARSAAASEAARRAEAQAERESALGDVVRLREETERLQARVEKLEKVKMTQGQVNRIKRMMTEREEFQKKAAALEREVTELKAREASHSATAGASSASGPSRAERVLQRELERQTQRVAELEATLDGAHEAADDARAAVADLTAEREVHESQRAQLTAALDAARRTAAASSGALAALLRACDDAAAGLALVVDRSDLVVDQTEADDDADVAGGGVDKDNGGSRRVGRRGRDGATRTLDATAIVSFARKVVASLVSALASSREAEDKAIQRVTVLRREAVAATERVEELEAALARAEAAVAAARDGRGVAADLAHERDRLRDDLARQRARADRAEADTTAVRAQLKAAEDARAGLEDAVQTLREAQASAEAQAERAGQEMGTAETRMAELQEAADRAEARAAAAEEALATAEEEGRRNVRFLEKENLQLMMELRALRTAAAEAQHTAEVARQQLEQQLAASTTTEGGGGSGRGGVSRVGRARGVVGMGSLGIGVGGEGEEERGEGAGVEEEPRGTEGGEKRGEGEEGEEGEEEEFSAGVTVAAAFAAPARTGVVAPTATAAVVSAPVSAVPRASLFHASSRSAATAAATRTVLGARDPGAMAATAGATGMAVGAMGRRTAVPASGPENRGAGKPGAMAFPATKAEDKPGDCAQQ